MFKNRPPICDFFSNPYIYWDKFQSISSTEKFLFLLGGDLNISDPNNWGGDLSKKLNVKLSRDLELWYQGGT